MKHKLVDSKLILGDILDPQIEIAVFSNITKIAQKEVVSTLNNGDDMLKLYKQYRNNLHINSVVELLEKMEEIYQKWEYEMYEAIKQPK